MNILRSISFAISTAVYPQIVHLYDMFEILGKSQFFTTESIQAISNNLYIFISVCMLFAFGIRLLNGIINPELLDEKKKGVKSVFLHAFIAVILIGFVPFGFNLLYSVQKTLITSHIIEKILLGTELKANQNPGQILASYTLSSFCHPTDSTKVAASSPLLEGVYKLTLYDTSALNMTILGKFINTKGGFIGELGTVISNLPGGQAGGALISGHISAISSAPIIKKLNILPYDLDYNVVLCPLVGIVVVYELVIMCIDLGLRSVKLGLLQLMAPIVLCGYIFKGTELLQKWFKEVITTWLLLFLKVAMVIFMLYGLSLLPDFLDQLDTADKDYKNWIKVIVLIGLLQLIKQLPNIINTIFGTNIQPRNGIKGRLAEMAVVGKMASDAWSGLGNKVKGLGATVGLGAAAAGGMLAKKGFDKIASGEGKAADIAKGIKDKYGRIKNGEVGRVARTAKAGINSGGKGTFKALKDAWDQDALTKQGIQNDKNKKQTEFNQQNSMNAAGTGSSWTNKDGKTISAALIKGRDENGNEMIMDVNQPYVKIPEIKQKDGESYADYKKRVEDRNKYAEDNKRKYHEARQKLLNADMAQTKAEYRNSGIPPKTVELLDEYEKATKAASGHKVSQAEQEKFLNFVESAKNNTAQGSAERDALEGLLGRMKADSFYTKRNDKGDIVRKSTDELINDINAVIQNSKGADGQVLDLERYFGGAYPKCLESVIKFNANLEGSLLSVGVGSLKTQVDTDGVALKNATEALNEYKNGTNVTAAEKSEIDNYENVITVKHTELAKEAGELAFINTQQGVTAQSMPVPEPPQQNQQQNQQQGQQQNPPQGQPQNQQQGQQTPTYDEHLKDYDKNTPPIDNGYAPGRYNAGQDKNSGNITNTVTGEVTANVDLSSLEKGLQEINRSVNNSGETVRREVNRQGTAIGRTLSDVSKNIGSMNNAIGKLKNPKDDDDGE